MKLKTFEDFKIGIPAKKKYFSYPSELVQSSPQNWNRSGYEKKLKKHKHSIDAIELDKYKFNYGKKEAAIDFFIWDKFENSWRVFVNLKGIKKADKKDQDKIYNTVVKIVINFIKEKQKSNKIDQLIILGGFPKEDVIQQEMDKIPGWDFKIENDSTIISH